MLISFDKNIFIMHSIKLLLNISIKIINSYKIMQAGFEQVKTMKIKKSFSRFMFSTNSKQKNEVPL